MSRFYAEIHGQAKTSATRTGSSNSGISGHIRGWDCGVEVEGFDSVEGTDLFAVFLTSGSNHMYGKEVIGHVQMLNGLPVFVPSTNTRIVTHNNTVLGLTS